MIKTGKCPGCGKVPTHLSFNGIEIKRLGQNTWNGVTYLCPLCNTILGAEIDPIALKADIVNEVVKKLRGKV
jgi:hypothetical protein